MSMIEFRNDEDGYLEWLAAHPNGYVLNVRRNPNPSYVVLHRASCSSISSSSRPDGAYTSRAYRKVCVTDMGQLKNAASAEGRKDGSFSKRCGLCRPWTVVASYAAGVLSMVPAKPRIGIVKRPSIE